MNVQIYKEIVKYIKSRVTQQEFVTYPIILQPSTLLNAATVQ